MRKIITILFIVFCTTNLYSQDDFSIVHVYRDKDLYSWNKIAKLFFNNALCIGLKGGNYDTLHVKPGCYDLRTNKNKKKFNKCFEPNRNYYYKVEYKYIFLFGRFNLLEVTEDFAQAELKGLEKKSLKK